MPLGPRRPGAAAAEALEDGLLLARRRPGPLVEDLDPARRRPRSSPSTRRASSAGRSPPARRSSGRGRGGRTRRSPARCHLPARRVIAGLVGGVAPALRRSRWRRRPGRPAPPGSSCSPARLRISSSSTISESRSISPMAPPRSSAVDRVLPPRRSPSALEPQPQPGQRGAQLVGGVGDEVLLRPQQPPDPLGHLVEGARQRALLGAALDRDRGVEVAAGDAARRPVEAADRPRDLLGDQGAGDQPQQQDDAGQRGQVEDRGPHRAVDGGDALGDPHRARRPAVLEHRHRGGEDLGAERLAVAGDLLAAGRAAPPAPPGGRRSCARPARRRSRRAGGRGGRRRSRGRGRWSRRDVDEPLAAPAARAGRAAPRRSPRRRRPGCGPGRAPRSRPGRAGSPPAARRGRSAPAAGRRPAPAGGWPGGLRLLDLRRGEAEADSAHRLDVAWGGWGRRRACAAASRCGRRASWSSRTS